MCRPPCLRSLSSFCSKLPLADRQHKTTEKQQQKTKQNQKKKERTSISLYFNPRTLPCYFTIPQFLPIMFISPKAFFFFLVRERPHSSNWRSATRVGFPKCSTQRYVSTIIASLLPLFPFSCSKDKHSIKAKHSRQTISKSQAQPADTPTDHINAATKKIETISDPITSLPIQSFSFLSISKRAF